MNMNLAVITLFNGDDAPASPLTAALAVYFGSPIICLYIVLYSKVCTVFITNDAPASPLTAALAVYYQ